MKHISFLKANILINILNYSFIPVFIIYLISMFIAPFIIEKGNWDYVQNVWYSWQSLNVGMLALISSVIALNISRINAEKQREREFIAARAFLPDALSELTKYFKACSPLLQEAWGRVNSSTYDNTPFKKSLPQQPPFYKDVFTKCITAAEPDVGNYLAYILMRIQIHHTRLQSLEKEFKNKNFEQIPANIISYIYRLGELQALVNKIFKFARGLEQFDNSPLELKQLTNAYLNLDIDIENFEDLSKFSEKALKNNSNKRKI